MFNDFSLYTKHQDVLRLGYRPGAFRSDDTTAYGWGIMAQYNGYQDRNGSGRMRGQSRGRTSGGSRGGDVRQAAGSRGYSGGSGRYSKYKKKKRNGMPPLLGGLGVLAIALICVFALRMGIPGGKNGEDESAPKESTEAYDPNVIHEDIYLDYSALDASAALLNLKGMNRQQLIDKLKGSYDWRLTVKNENPNLDHFKLPELSEQAETSSAGAGSTDNEGTEEIVKIDNPLKNVTIRPEKGSFAVPDLLSENVEQLAEKIFADYQSSQETIETEAGTAESETEKQGFFSFMKKKETETSTETETTTEAVSADYRLELPDFSSQLSDLSSQLALVWDMPPVNGDIVSFDASSGEFVFGGTVDGYRINAEETASKLLTAVRDGSFNAEIPASGEKLAASSASIRDQYKTIGSFTTNTTSNSIRNQNVKLAAQAVNGTVLKPGEEFSFNEVVGQRTAEKGYGAAAAYNGGEVVQEVGGGVCQVSSTLYNAVFRSGLTTTYRRSHTFAPNYVRPGSDATVSWGGPDYRFVNSSKHAIGIRAWYKDQTCTVQLYGIPVLPEGESWDLVTEKVEDLPVPAPQIITPEQGAESNGSAGSRWIAYKIIRKNGKEQKIEDHKVTYKGHTPKKYAEGVASAAESTPVESASETETAESTSTETKKQTDAVQEAPTTAERSGNIDAHPGSESEGNTDNDRIPAGPGL